MKVGFTGTQYGMTDHQKRAVRELLGRLKPSEFHHGDCVGADEEAHEIVRSLPFEVKIVSHPPSNPKKRAFCKADEEREPKPYLERNRDIVDDTSVLVACPSSVKEVLRSGTWTTWRYARKSSREIYLIVPS